MKITENQIGNDTIILLKSLLGKTLESIMREYFTFPPTSYGAVYITVDKNDYILTDYYEQRERVDMDEEVSVLRFKKDDCEFTSTIKKQRVHF